MHKKIRKERDKMAKDRIEVCKYYQAMGEKCKKGRTAIHNGYCQKCSKYEPRARVRHLNEKKQKIRKQQEKELRL